MHELSQEIQKAVQNAVESYSREILIRNGRFIIKKYKEQTAENRRLSTDEEAAAYAVSRMPATFGAAHFAVTEMARILRISHVKSLLDCGSGTGAVVMAVNDILSPEIIYAQEYEPKMASMGSKILEFCDLKTVVTLHGNICEKTLPETELVTEGYVLGELTCAQRKKALLNMWSAAKRFMLIVEPGTKEGFSIIQEAKALLRGEGAHVVAPCAADCCPVDNEDWCHFSVRISRSQLHKTIKKGEAPYEDEKFCYVIFSRESFTRNIEHRIIRHPIIEQGRITLSLCSKNGKQEIVITRKDPLWKRARKSKWGETIEAY